MTVPRRAAIGALCMALGLAGFPTAGSADPAADLAAKRRQAAAVAAELDDLEEASSIAVEEYLQAQLASEALQAQVEAAKTRVAQTDEALGTAQEQVKAAALRAYVRGGETGVLPRAMAVARAGPDAPLTSSGTIYGEVAIGLTRDVVDRLNAARNDHEVEQAQLTVRLADQQRSVADQDSRRAAADAAVAAQEAKLDSVKGELAELVRQEEERRRRPAGCPGRPPSAAGRPAGR